MFVRPYEPADRAAVLELAADMAFFGEPLEAFLEDRRLFTEAFCAYYTDLEPEHVWVACAEGRVVGYLFGCLDTPAQRRRWRREVLPRLIGRALGGRYHLGRLTARYVLAHACGLLRGEFPRVDLASYPAHLHVGVAAPWRGRGLGRKLLGAFLAQARAAGVPGAHLETTSQNVAACRLYERLGFRLLDARPTRLWAGLVDGPVENRCYGLKL